MINFLKRILCFLVTHNWGPEKYLRSDSCQMMRTCQRCNDVQTTQVVHVWGKKDNVDSNSCQIINICQRCGLSQETHIPHEWDKTHIDGEVMQKCKRCEQVQLEWPELETVKGTEFTEAMVMIKSKVATIDETENPQFQPLVSHWGPIVTHLLGRVAAITAWHGYVSSEDVDKPWHITRSTEHSRIVWEVGRHTYMAWGNAASGGNDYFTVTLNTTENYEPLNFEVLSQHFKFRTELSIESLKTALVRAYVDGPAFSTWGSHSGYFSSKADVREETIP